MRSRAGALPIRRYSFPDPLPERSLRLEPMGPGDLPATEDDYWSICDEFVGGSRFIRVLGPPLWLQEPEREVCPCGREMEYVAGIGYGRESNAGGYLDEGAFMIGEGALYFFLCGRCLRLAVMSQPT